MSGKVKEFDVYELSIDGYSGIWTYKCPKDIELEFGDHALVFNKNGVEFGMVMEKVKNFKPKAGVHYRWIFEKVDMKLAESTMEW